MEMNGRKSVVGNATRKAFGFGWVGTLLFIEIGAQYVFKGNIVR